MAWMLRPHRGKLTRGSTASIRVKHLKCLEFVTTHPDAVVACPYCGARVPEYLREEFNRYVGHLEASPDGR